MKGSATFKKRILSLDGGGMKGLGILSFFKLLEEKTGKHPAEHFDYCIGTSTGALILACLLLLKFSVEETRKLYLEMGKVVFQEKMSLLSSPNAYDPEPLEKLLKSYFGDKTFGDFPVSEKFPMISFICNEVDLLPPQQLILSNYNPEYADMPIWVALRATTAAPTYFPPVLYKKHSLIDGGLGDMCFF